MNPCQITVIRCTFDAQLVEQYIDDPAYGPCPYFRPGQVFISPDGERPEDFPCRIGWKSIRDEVQNITENRHPFPGGRPHIVCCNDGCRPVIFKLERADTPAPDGI